MVDNKPLLLSEDEKANPELVIKEFYSAYTISQIRALIKLLLSGSIERLTPDESEQIQKFKFFKQQLIRMLEAAWIINKKQQ